MKRSPLWDSLPSFQPSLGSKNSEYWTSFSLGTRGSTRLDNFSNADCQLLADNLQKSTLTHLSRFSFSVLRSVITSEGLATVIEQISKASALQDIHISIMRVSTIDESALVTLADFLDHSRAHLKRFEFSAFWYRRFTRGAKRSLQTRKETSRRRS